MTSTWHRSKRGDSRAARVVVENDASFEVSKSSSRGKAQCNQGPDATLSLCLATEVSSKVTCTPYVQFSGIDHEKAHCFCQNCSRLIDGRLRLSWVLVYGVMKGK